MGVRSRSFGHLLSGEFQIMGVRSRSLGYFYLERSRSRGVDLDHFWAPGRAPIRKKSLQKVLQKAELTWAPTCVVET